MPAEPLIAGQGGQGVDNGEMVYWLVSDWLRAEAQWLAAHESSMNWPGRRWAAWTK
jgi:hypothetical protein